MSHHANSMLQRNREKGDTVSKFDFAADQQHIIIRQDCLSPVKTLLMC